VLVGLALTAGVIAQQRRQSEIDLQSAIRTETIDRDISAAVVKYQKVADQYSKTDRAVASSALLHLADCYRRSGIGDARVVYERIVRDFGDQTSAVREAKARVAALAQSTRGALSPGAPRRVWTAARSEQEGGNPLAHQYGKVSRSGRLLPFVTYGRTRGLFVHDLTTGVDRRVVTPLDTPGAYPDYTSVVSPDDRFVAYLWARASPGGFELLITDLTSAHEAPPRVLFSNEDVRVPWVYDWSADGKSLAVALQRADSTFQLALVSVIDGSVHVLKTMDWRNQPTNLSFSPDGKYIAFNLPQGDSSARDVFVMATDATREIPAVVHKQDDVVLGWSPDGRQLLFTSDRTGSLAIYATSFAQNSFAESHLLKRDVGEFGGLGLTSAGSLFYITKPTAVPSQLMSAVIDFANGNVVSRPQVAVDEHEGTNDSPVVSHDGQHMAYVSRRGGFFFPRDRLEVLLVLRTTDGNDTRELRPKLDSIFSPQWLPDDQGLTVEGSDFEGRTGIWRIDARTGDAAPIAVVSASSSDRPPAAVRWSTNGRRMYFWRQTNRPETPAAVFAADMALFERDVRTGAERQVAQWFTGFVKGGRARDYEISPDGQTLFYARGSVDAGSALRANDPGFALIAHDMTSGRGTVLFQGTRLFWLSPDGKYLVTGSRGLSTQPGNAVMLVPTDGQPPRNLKEVGPLTIAFWARDSQSLIVQTGAYGDRKELWWLPIDGRAPRQLDLGLTEGEFLTHAIVHPDGRRLAYVKNNLAESFLDAKIDVWSIDNIVPSTDKKR